ncbi:hypothetical protein, partial [Bilophila wadsworthia]|uniref:hypothetical protein n=1 Tax=Bilophila wadsworthia TaxID=35833 RepID=UPI00307B76A3
RTSFFAAVGIFHVDGWYKSKTEAGEGIKKTLVRFFIPSLYHHTKFFCFFVQMRVYDRGFAVFRFHHDGPNALILAEREREGSGSLFRSLFQSMDGRIKQRVRAKKLAGRGTDRKIKAHSASPFSKMCQTEEVQPIKTPHRQYLKRARNTTVDCLSVASAAMLSQQDGTPSDIWPKGFPSVMVFEDGFSLSARCPRKRLDAGKSYPGLNRNGPQGSAFRLYMKSEGMIPYFFSLR